MGGVAISVWTGVKHSAIAAFKMGLGRIHVPKKVVERSNSGLLSMRHEVLKYRFDLLWMTFKINVAALAWSSRIVRVQPGRHVCKAGVVVG
ncbi:hypothetical protein IQA72_17500, partial [Leptospira borgpetersenii serovar Ballum]|uniref:hypothetical protein n=1 Tax=Leptospira borgpetersenii TaxID=174 RepID=UPI0018818D57